MKKRRKHHSKRRTSSKTHSSLVRKFKAAKRALKSFNRRKKH